LIRILLSLLLRILIFDDPVGEIKAWRKDAAWEAEHDGQVKRAPPAENAHAHLKK